MVLVVLGVLVKTVRVCSFEVVGLLTYVFDSDDARGRRKGAAI
jgi:hypothetical protein